MDGSLVHRVMSHTTASDAHAVAGILQEYVAAAHLARRTDRQGSEWRQVAERIEHCLRLYLKGQPIATALQLGGYAPHEGDRDGAAPN